MFQTLPEKQAEIQNKDQHSGNITDDKSIDKGNFIVGGLNYSINLAIYEIVTDTLKRNIQSGEMAKKHYENSLYFYQEILNRLDKLIEVKELAIDNG